MTETVFRTKSTPAVTETAQPKAVTPVASTESKIEVPYNDYHTEHGHPYLVDHYQLGDSWNNPVGGFASEVSTISNYIDSKIESGEVANSQEAVKGLLKTMEKFNNLKGEERPVVKLGVLAAYIRFLTEKSNLAGNLKKYAT